MSKLYIGFNSAFLFYRKLRVNNKINLTNSRKYSTLDFAQSKCANTLENINGEMASLFPCARMDIMLNNASRRHKFSNIKFHVYTGKLPKQSFIKIKQNLYVASPELVFCQLASIVSYEQLIVLGLEMCGTYTLSLRDAQLVSGVLPITSAAWIKKFIDNLKEENKNFKGMKLACKVANTLADNSASPQESKLFALLASTRNQGGLGIKNLELNAKINLSAQARKALGHPSIKPDIVLQKAKVAIEYDSTSYHENELQDSKDKMRMNAYKIDNWKVYSIVPQIIKNPDRLLTIFIEILNQCCPRYSITRNDFKTKFINLYKNLYFSKF